MCLTVHAMGVELIGGRKAMSLKAMLASEVEFFYFFNGIYFTNFLVVLGLPPASEIPQYPPLPGACLESQIHGE